MNKITYKDGYKYQLVEQYQHKTNIKVPFNLFFDWVGIQSDGTLVIEKGYAWDGATGAWDTPGIMRASLVHDALYQLIRLKAIPSDQRIEADKLLRDIAIEDGVNKFRAAYVYAAVRVAGKPFANNKERPAKLAP
jgi:hypothetical protein